MKNKNEIYLFSKRIFDIIFSLIFIIISLPFQILIFVLLLIELKELPLFIQKRGIVLNEKIFEIIKFKTIKSKLPNIIQTDVFVKRELENQIGKFSRFLRITGLDELPQLYNVLFGQMSLIGPRPLMIEDLIIIKNQFPEFYEIRKKLNSKPGLSGLWQLYGKRDLGIENLIELEQAYEEKKSLLLDIKLLIKTFFVIFTQKNSDAIFGNKKSYSNFYKRTEKPASKIDDNSNSKTLVG